jgi:uncharacterized protein (TIGR00730 family)
MQDFTASGPSPDPSPTAHTGHSPFDQRIRQLVADWGCDKSSDIIEEMIVTALKLGRDQTSTADLKLFNRALKEMRYAARVFAPYRHLRKCVVFGSARTPQDAPESQMAEEFARRIVERGYMVITGGGDGIMGAAQRGAGRERSFGLNIRLPFEQRSNETIHGDPKLIYFNYFFTRKLNFVKETHAIVLFPGGFGTMDEGFEVLTLMQTGKGRIIPFVLVDTPEGTFWKKWLSFVEDDLLAKGLVAPEDFHLFKLTSDLAEAEAEVVQFYKNFRSYRWVGDRVSIRLEHRLEPGEIERMNRDFRDLLIDGDIVQTTALPEEKNEPELLELPRIILTPFRRKLGRLRQLIDAVNTAKTT